MSFENLGLSPTLLNAIKKAGFEDPTPVQKLCIPEILNNKSIVVKAQTGTGKTASFVLPILEKLKDTPLEKTVKVLVLTPTRELAIQTTGVFFKFAQYIPHKLSFLAVIGGESIAGQNKTLQYGVEVIIATPGRLLDLIDQQTIDLKAVEILIFDEADKILDLSFEKEIGKVLSLLPLKRQNLFFSATYPDRILNLIPEISPSENEKIEIMNIENTHDAIDNIFQRAIAVNRDNRNALLRHLIQTEKWEHALIFVNSKQAAINLALKLKKYHIDADCLHGDLSQADRNLVLSDFKSRKLKFMIATDVAARGIDITKLPLVINFDLPRSPLDYIHRIGRTGRANEKGLALSFVTLENHEHFQLIQKKTKINIDLESVPGHERVGEIQTSSKGQAPIKGKRKSKKDKLREKLGTGPIIIHDS